MAINKGVVTVTPASMLEAASKMEAAADAIDKSIARIDEAVSGMSSDWNDKNARIYLERYNELKQAFPDFKNAVRNYSVFLGNVVDLYNKEYTEKTYKAVSMK